MGPVRLVADAGAGVHPIERRVPDARDAMNGVERFLSTQRALGREIYLERPPSPDLRGWVGCLWLRVGAPRVPGVRIPVIPDGCVDIMTFDDSPPSLAGPATRTHWASMPAGLVITGIRFRPGSVGAVFGVSATELTDRDAELVDVASRSGELEAALDGCDDLEARFQALESWVRRAVERAKSRDAQTVSAARRMLTDPSCSIGELASELGWNARRMHREFEASCGYGPKLLQRILRVQVALRVAHTSGAQLAHVAAISGYADQAHMTRDFRSITGFTPTAFLALGHGEVGRWVTDWCTDGDVRFVQDGRCARR